jgi:hypothetical protein
MTSQSVAVPEARGDRPRLGAAARALAARLRAELQELWHADPALQRWLLAFGVLQLLALFWDQPGYYGWENDGVAPRSLLGGIAQNLIPGHADRYPLFHSLLLGVLALPILVADVSIALSRGEPVADAVISVPSMTAIAVASKLLHLACSLVALLAFARIFSTLFGRLASRWGVAFALTNLSVGYYGRVTNVDMAYLTWVALWLDRLLLFARQRRRSDLALLGFSAAAALATKDQAYASFILPTLLVWGWLLEGHGHARALSLAQMLRVALPAYLLLSGALFNPFGFVRHVRELVGTNSQDWRQYEASAAGLLANLRDLFEHQREYWWPGPVVAAAWLGAGLAPFNRWGSQIPAQPALARWLPLSAGLSATLGFTLLVGRSEHRFLLPLGFWLSGYAGVAIAGLPARGGSRALPLLAGSTLTALAALHSAQLLVTQWCDPRRDVERFLKQLPAGSHVETYGHGVYQPRFDFSPGSPYRVTRVSAPGSTAPPRIRGMLELRDDFAAVEQRRPDLLVIPDEFARRFLSDASSSGTQRAMDTFRQAPGATWFFRSAVADRLPGYHLLELGRPRLPDWYTRLGGSIVRVHGSTGARQWLLQRERP